MSKNAPSRRPTGRPRGRPPSTASDRDFWNAQWGKAAVEICEAVAGGSGLGDACAKYREITPPMFLRWVEQHPAQLKLPWDRAKAARAASMFEGIIGLADEIEKLAKTAKDHGTKRQCLVEAAKIKLWGAARLDPASYGDRAQPGSGVAIQINTTLPLDPADLVDDGSGTFTIKVAQGSAPDARDDEERGAMPVKSLGDPSTAEWEPL